MNNPFGMTAARPLTRLDEQADFRPPITSRAVGAAALDPLSR
jgi:hypothetical protein